MIINKIDTEDISVIVQGAIDKKNTQRCLISIRKYLPGSTIILSTWEGSNVEGLTYDKLVVNSDPGGYICDKVHGTKNNVARQIVSTLSGLKNATTTYSLKIRSDLELVGNNFLNYFEMFPHFSEKLKILKARVLVNSLYTRGLMPNPNTLYDKLLYHPSDWICFGYTQDLINIWDIPLPNEPTFSTWFEKRKRPNMDPCRTWLFRYVPEQYIWLSFLQKNVDGIKFEHFGDNTYENLGMSELSIVNNLVVLDYKEQYDFEFKKYDIQKHVPYNIHRHYYWLLLYKKYCDPQYRIPLKYKVNEVKFRVNITGNKLKSMTILNTKHIINTFFVYRG